MLSLNQSKLFNIRKDLYVYFILFGIFTYTNTLHGQSYSPSDSIALLKIDSACDANNLLNWNTEPNIQNWEHIVWAGSKLKRVFGLQIINLSLSGTLDVTELDSITFLECQYNNLEAINLNGLVYLVFFDCAFNKITELNISGITYLDLLNCTSNEISSLTLGEGLDNLRQLNCENNQIEELNLSNLKALDLNGIYCDSNKIANLNLDGLDLTNLHCSNNQLATLNVSNQSRLSILYCDGNQLIELNVSELPLLYELNCYKNQLPFSSLATGLHSTFFEYKPQYALYDPDTITRDTTLNYSTEAIIKDTSFTQFTFFKDDEIEEENTTGIFSTNGPGVYFCEMRNELFPNTILKTAEITYLNESISPTNFGLEYTVFPNPAKDFVKLIVSDNHQIKQIELLNTSGVCVYYCSGVQQQYTIPLESLERGIYFIRMICESELYFKKLIIQ